MDQEGKTTLEIAKELNLDLTVVQAELKAPSEDETGPFRRAFQRTIDHDNALFLYLTLFAPG